jgi:hypothetical protein
MNEKPEIHEIGLAEDVVHGPLGDGLDMIDRFTPELTLADFEE